MGRIEKLNDYPFCLIAKRTGDCRSNKIKEENAMTKQEFLHELEQMMELDHGSLTGEEALLDLPAWDSLQILNLLVLVDDKFGVVIDGVHVMEAKTVNDLLALVDIHIQGYERQT